MFIIKSNRRNTSRLRSPVDFARKFVTTHLYTQTYSANKGTHQVPTWLLKEHIKYNIDHKLLRDNNYHIYRVQYTKH